MDKAKFEDYEGFTEKFKPKKTTDDCYTPPAVMEVVNDYVSKRWGLDPLKFVRPFWPGGDYESFDYPEGCIVVDNPPFSIHSKIRKFYTERGIPFFLFAPLLICLSGRDCESIDHILPNADITYENGAVVKSAFVTNLCSDYVLETEPELGERLTAACATASKKKAKISYPVEVLTAARAAYLASHGVNFKVSPDDAVRVTKLDAMGKRVIFGGGLLLSERAAAERAAAERAAAERAAAEHYELSDREKEIQKGLGKHEN